MPRKGERISVETRAKMADARRRWWETAPVEKRTAVAEKQRGQRRPSVSDALKGRPKDATRYAHLITGKWMPCETCGAQVWRTPRLLASLGHVFCSRACFASWYSGHRRLERAEMTCLTCGTSFPRLASRAKWNNGNHYCSRACAQAAKTGAGHPAWAGGRQKRSDGYVDVNRSLVPEEFRSMCRKDGRVMEHRLVKAQTLGRPLADWEVVHHVNGVRDDNRPENLELHPEHEHNGITAMSQRDRQIAALRAQIADLQERLGDLESAPKEADTR